MRYDVGEKELDGEMIELGLEVVLDDVMGDERDEDPGVD